MFKLDATQFLKQDDILEIIIEEDNARDDDYDFKGEDNISYVKIRYDNNVNEIKDNCYDD